MSSAAHNYLEDVAGIQPQAPATERQPLAISEETPGAITPPGITNGNGERVSPELLTELKTYIEHCVVETVSSALTTIVPDVVESTVAKISQPAGAASAAPAPVTQPLAKEYETPVPMMHMASTPYRRHSSADWACWAACGGIVAAMAGLAAYTLNMAPQSQTVRQNEQLNQSHQALTERLVESNQQVLDSRQRCGNFSLICNIKE